MGFAEVLTIVFAIAKVMGKLDFTWFQVFLPMIITYAFLLVVIVLGLIIKLVVIVLGLIIKLVCD